MFPAARHTDPITHDTLVPCGVIGPPLTGPCPMGPVMIEGMPAAHVNCTAVCTGVISAGIAHPPPPPPKPPALIIAGSPTVMIHGMPAARWTPAPDAADCGVFLGDPKLAATRTVLIGDTGSGSSGSGSPGSGSSSPAPAASAFQKAAESGSALVCKGPCKAGGQL